MRKIINKTIIIITIILLFNTTVTIYADEFEENEDEQIIQEIQQETPATVESSSNKSTPTINSRRYTVFDRKSGTSIMGKYETKQSAMASTTKIMTGIVVLEKCENIEEVVTIDEKSAGIGGSRLGVKKDDKITVNDLLYGLLMKSGNDAAVALAIHTAGSVEEFSSLMNKKAEELGLIHTHFITPHGLDDPNHYSTAIELAKLTDYALNNSIFATIVKTKYAVININGQQKQLKNTNEVLCGDYDGVYGVKTGFTNNAGRCLVTSVKRGDVDLIIVVLGADTRKDRAKDTIKLIDYAYQNYRLTNIEERAKEEFENWKQINQDRIIVYKARNRLECKLDKIKIEEIVTNKEISFEINTINYLEAPVEENMVIGSIIVRNGEEEIEQINIVVDKKIEKLNIADYIKIIARFYCR